MVSSVRGITPLRILKTAAIMFFMFALYTSAVRATEPLPSAESIDLFTAPKSYALAMHGAPKYAEDFTNFNYVNPDAPKGGTLRLAGAETFDNLNQFITKGVSAQGLGFLYQSLLTKSQDEPFTMYGDIAETIQTPENRKWVIFTIRKEARWHDGQSITAHDVVWSFETLTEKGSPFFKAYYADVEKVQALDDNTVQFTFRIPNNRELPLIVGEMNILPKHYWTADGRDFAATTLEAPLGSGPYKIGKVVAGQSLEYQRVDDWWAKDLAVNKGRYNFDRITYDYYRDQNVSLEALFANEYDYRQEYTAKLWASGYDVPPVTSGRLKKEMIKNALPQGMQGFVMNMRRQKFQDLSVRKAMDLAFDYEWSNKQFAFSAYTRTRSYFENSEMAATGLPTGKELEVLEPYRAQLPERVFTTEYNPAKTDGSGNNRKNLRKAMKLLDDAGYVLNEQGVRVHKDTGIELRFEFLVSNTNAAFQRWFLPYKQNLQRIGIVGDIRIVDASQYINRILEFDYDVIVSSWGQSTSPGNEQREYWNSAKADIPGSRNYIGVKDPVVDAIIEQIVSAPTREDLIARCRALDRVLQNGYYVIPNWHLAAWRIAYWDKFGKPAVQAPYSLGIHDTWWVKAE